MTSSVPDTVDELRRELLDKIGDGSPRQIEKLRSGQRSGAERLHLSGGETRVFRWASGLDSSEDYALSYATCRGVPVPTVYCSALRGGLLGMLLADLGPPARAPRDADAATAVARLHQAGRMPGAPQLGQAELRGLPAEVRFDLAALRAVGRFTDTGYLDAALTTLERVAPRRVVGAEIAPFGLCHTALTPESLHVGPTGWWLTEFTEARTAPVLLSLAAWHGPHLAPRLPRMRRLIAAFIAAGGPTTARVMRGGLPAENWALGWHRLHLAAEHLRRAAADLTDASADSDQAVIVGRYLRSAARLLNPVQHPNSRYRPAPVGGDG